MPASITGGTTTITTTTITTTSSSSTRLCRPTGTSRRCPPRRARRGTASACSRTREGPRSWEAARRSCAPAPPAWAPAPRPGPRARQGTTAARRCHPRRRRREVAARGKATAQVRARRAPSAKGAGRRRAHSPATARRRALRDRSFPRWLLAAKFAEAALVLLCAGTCFSEGSTAASCVKLSKIQTSLPEG